jgi:hypothetical protein
VSNVLKTVSLAQRATLFQRADNPPLGRVFVLRAALTGLHETDMGGALRGSRGFPAPLFARNIFSEFHDSFRLIGPA